MGHEKGNAVLNHQTNLVFNIKTNKQIAAALLFSVCMMFIGFLFGFFFNDLTNSASSRYASEYQERDQFQNQEQNPNPNPNQENQAQLTDDSSLIRVTNNKPQPMMNDNLDAVSSEAMTIEQCQLISSLYDQQWDLSSNTEFYQLMSDINSLQDSAIKQMAITAILSITAVESEGLEEGVFEFLIENPNDVIANQLYQQNYSHKLLPEQRQQLRQNLVNITDPNILTDSIKLTSQVSYMTEEKKQQFNQAYQQFYYSPYDNVRAAAIEVIGVVSRDDEVMLLTDALSDPSDAVIDMALDVIGKRQLTDPQLLSALEELHYQRTDQLNTAQQRDMVEHILFESGAI